uniref:Uncharacterized protein n=1 Tax=Tanacetum cinerariifolium TaxID=118510 RepID=A0A699H0W3_TANCI|nr:hypothetical protein [Tanacetum cinerariifolium]
MVVQSQLDEGSSMPTNPHHTPIILQSSSSQPQKTHKPRKPTRKVTEIPQPSDPIEHVANEVVYKELGDSWCQEAMGDTLAQIRFENVSKQERRIDDIDADEDITLVNVQADAEMFDADKD